jgi:SAM-dependent methyltransferase
VLTGDPPEQDDPARYGRSFADVYDRWYADSFDTPGAVAALRELAGPGPILELGVGTGRLAVPLARSGLEVVGIDASVEMIERIHLVAGNEGPHAIIGDMRIVDRILRDAGRDERFSLAFCAFNTLLNLPDDDAVTRCLRGTREVLAPDGLVVIEALVPIDESDIPARSLGPARVDSASVVFIETTWDRSTRRLEGRHVEVRDGAVTQRPWSVLVRSPEQIDAAAAEAGLILHDRWSDWAATPFDDASSTHISIFGLDRAGSTSPP